MAEMVTGELIDALRTELLARPEVREAYLFGSAARGEARAHSDLVPSPDWLSRFDAGSGE
jgi:predicted nucleotidyltransferase